MDRPMNRPTNICPLMCIAGSGGPCIKERCAWWCFDGFECAAVTAAIAFQEVAENLETLAENSEALTDLQKKAAPSAANTEDGKGPQQSN